MNADIATVIIIILLCGVSYFLGWDHGRNH